MLDAKKRSEPGSRVRRRRQLQQAIDRLVTDRSLVEPATEIAGTVAAEHGTRNAVDRIQAFIATGATEQRPNPHSTIPPPA